MSPPVPRTAMVFAAGLGKRMRPITDTLPKPLVKVGGRALIDHCLDRLAENGVDGRSSTCIGSPIRSRPIWRSAGRRRNPHLRRADELLDQGGGIKRALPMIGDGSFPPLQYRRVLDRGPAVEYRPPRAGFDAEAMDVLLLVAASAGAVGVDWPGDFTMAHDGRLEPREPRHVAPFVYTGVGIVKPELFAKEKAEVFRLAPFFYAAAARGRLFGVRLDGFWLHVGRPETIAEAEWAIDRSIL